METVYRDYKSKGVQFFYVYKTVEHPEVNGFVQPFNLKERLKHIEIAKKRFKSEIPWICDTMDNDVKKAFGNSPNGEFILDPDGQIIIKRFWSNPKTLRGDLEILIGKSDTTTKVEDLPARFYPKPNPIASNVVPKIKLKDKFMAVMTKPAESEDPHFAKLRVEVSQKLLQTKEGSILFGVYLDPIYKVHWNNRAGKVKIEIETDETFIIEKNVLVGPEVKENADIDPRQFVVEATANVDKKAPTPIKVKLTYTVCDDDETFCKEFVQDYTVVFEPNRHGGTRPGVFLNSLVGNVRDMDANGDGNVTPDELPLNQVSMFIGHMDYNGNDVIEKEEIDYFMRMFNNGRGMDRYNDGEWPKSTESDDDGNSKSDESDSSESKSDEK